MGGRISGRYHEIVGRKLEKQGTSPVFACVASIRGPLPPVPEEEKNGDADRKKGYEGSDSLLRNVPK